MRGYEAGNSFSGLPARPLGALQRLQKWARTRTLAVHASRSASSRARTCPWSGWMKSTGGSSPRGLSKQATDTNYAHAELGHDARAYPSDPAGRGRSEHLTSLSLTSRAQHAASRIVSSSRCLLRGDGHPGRSCAVMLSAAPVRPGRQPRDSTSHFLPGASLEENVAPENLMSGVFDIATNEDVFTRNVTASRRPSVDPGCRGARTQPRSGPPG